MNKILQILGTILSVAVLSSATPALADNPNAYISVGGAAVYTNSYSNLTATSAILQGNLAIPYSTNSNYIWFQWGTTTSYGNETTHQFLASGGAFSQQITGLTPNTTYHFRAVAQLQNGTTIYGQDSSLYTTSSGGALTISKKVINLTTNNLNWSEYQSARPGDVLSFAIVLQASGQDIYNVTISDTLPQNLYYKGDLIVNSQLNYPGNIFSGIDIGTIKAGETAIISYRAQVADSSIIPYGTTTLTSTASISGSGINYKTSTVSVVITNTQTAGISTGPTTISTGLTNNFFTDSFFLPLLIIIFGLWLCFSGKIYKFADWLKNR